MWQLPISTWWLFKYNIITSSKYSYYNLLTLSRYINSGRKTCKYISKGIIWRSNSLVFLTHDDQFCILPKLYSINLAILLTWLDIEFSKTLSPRTFPLIVKKKKKRIKTHGTNERTRGIEIGQESRRFSNYSERISVGYSSGPRVEFYHETGPAVSGEKERGEHLAAVAQVAASWWGLLSSSKPSHVPKLLPFRADRSFLLARNSWWKQSSRPTSCQAHPSNGAPTLPIVHPTSSYFWKLDNLLLG